MKKLLLLSLLAIQPLGAKKKPKKKPKKDLTLVYVSLAAMGVGSAILIYDHWSNYNTKEEESLEKRLSRLQTPKKIDLPELPKIDEGELEKWELQEEKEKSQNLINHLQARIYGADEGEDTTHLQKMKEDESLEVARLERERVEMERLERKRVERKREEYLNNNTIIPKGFISSQATGTCGHDMDLLIHKYNHLQPG